MLSMVSPDVFRRAQDLYSEACFRQRAFRWYLVAVVGCLFLFTHNISFVHNSSSAYMAHMFLQCLIDCKLQTFDNFQTDKLTFYSRIFRANFEWKIAALTWAITVCKQTSALEKLEGQARWYCKMNKRTSFFVCYCWSPERMTADDQNSV